MAVADDTTRAPADLAADTAVRADGDVQGRYRARLPAHWNYWLPSGGVTMTLALRAIVAELADPALRPVSATTVFCTPVPHGPITIDVHVLRRGTTAAQVRARLTHDDAESQPVGLEVIATFMRERDGHDVRDVEPPAVPRPDELPVFTREPGRWVPEFSRNFEQRLATGDRWWIEREWTGGPARSGYWFRYLAPQRLPDGRLDPLALPPVIDTMPGALFQKIGPTALRSVAPSLDLTVHFLEDTDREWLLTHVHSRRARGGVATADVEIWDDTGRLLAYGTQMMFLRRRRRPPSG